MDNKHQNKNDKCIDCISLVHALNLAQKVITQIYKFHLMTMYT